MRFLGMRGFQEATARYNAFSVFNTKQHDKRNYDVFRRKQNDRESHAGSVVKWHRGMTF